ncbi:MAG: DUF1028 domain-containing protein [Bacteroidota bacterium]
MRFFTLLLFLVTASLAFAQHTFSIVAVDTNTGEVGSAGATCLDLSDCSTCTAAIISGLVPGQGAINAQASVCLPNVNLNNGLDRLEAGDSPQEVLDWLFANDACPFGNNQNRQYGVVDLDDDGNARTAAFTGTEAFDHADHRVGPTYAIQGNILLGPEILDDMETGFLTSTGTLAERLMAALQEANVAGADTRCLDEGVSSRSAYLRVARPDDDADDLFLDLLVPQTPVGMEPIDSLQTLFDAFQLTNTVLTSSADDFFRVYPNPTVGQLQVQLTSLVPPGATLELMWLNGQSIQTYPCEQAQKVTIPLDENYASGLKFLVLKTAQGRVLGLRKIFTL